MHSNRAWRRSWRSPPLRYRVYKKSLNGSRTNIFGNIPPQRPAWGTYQTTGEFTFGTNGGEVGTPGGVTDRFLW